MAERSDENGELETLPRAEFGFPGPLRDRLVAAILDGAKTATTSLLADYEHHGEPLPTVGARSSLVDSHDRRVAVLEVVDVACVRLADVDSAHASAEGEGHATVAHWRADHEDFWHSDAMRESLEDDAFAVDDDTIVVLERFRLEADLRHAV